MFVGSVRQNILFGQPFVRERYNHVVKVCALKRDFQLLPYADKTIVGERGVSLSGGQRARANLARCVDFRVYSGKGNVIPAISKEYRDGAPCILNFFIIRYGDFISCTVHLYKYKAESECPIEPIMKVKAVFLLKLAST